MENIKFNLRGKIIEIPSVELDNDEEWYITRLVNYDKPNDNGEYKIFEDEEIFMNIIESFRHKTLIMTDCKKIDYFFHLADKWCLPNWIFELIKKEKEKKDLLENTIFDIINNPIKFCKLCQTGFKEKENTSNSCKFHPGKFLFHTNKYECCGRTKEEECCKIGYHLESIETKMKLLYMNK